MCSVVLSVGSVVMLTAGSLRTYQVQGSLTYPPEGGVQHLMYLFWRHWGFKEVWVNFQARRITTKHIWVVLLVNCSGHPASHDYNNLNQGHTKIFYLMDPFGTLAGKGVESLYFQQTGSFDFLLVFCISPVDPGLYSGELLSMPGLVAFLFYCGWSGNTPSVSWL